jgi:beta-glucosidase/6-phospho-beta-glucosidase/beta-galactosidase
VRLLLVGLLTVAVAAPAAHAQRFPRHFVWGVATSGFQTEMGGTPANADRGSDWWAWTHADTGVSDDRPERGPGSWNAFRRDNRLARGLGVAAFRLGIEWSRIFPRATDDAGGVRELDALADQRAVRHYRAVLRDVRRRGLTPFVTVNHFTLPLWIHDPLATQRALAGRGADDPLPEFAEPAGWLQERTVREFAKYADYLAWKLGDLVRFWTPINEPVVVATNGYVNVPAVFAGNFPPGALSYTAAYTAFLNLADANARAYDAIKGRDRDARVGLVQNMIAFTPRDTDAGRHADQLFNRAFLDAAIRGVYDRDADGTVDEGEREPELAGKADFLGVNYYFRGRVTALGQPVSTRIPLLDFAPSVSYRTARHPELPECPTTCSGLGSELYAPGFRAVLRTAGSYGLPVYITENGVADATDRLRPSFLRAHLRVLRRAMRDGLVRARGYFHWSLTDNFEWAEGYAPKFGLFTRERRARRSARLFERIVRG